MKWGICQAPEEVSLSVFATDAVQSRASVQWQQTIRADLLWSKVPPDLVLPACLYTLQALIEHTERQLDAPPLPDWMPVLKSKLELQQGDLENIADSAPVAR